MTPGLLAMLAAMCLTGGVVLLVAGVRPAPVRPGGAPRGLAGWWARVTGRPAGSAGRRRDVVWLVVVAVTIVAFVVTRWVVVLALVPAVAVVGPKLLGQAPPTDIPLLEALDRWVRQIAAILPQGRDVATAVRISRTKAPELIAEEVGRLVTRLNGRTDPAEAFQRMADELDNAEADAVLASLALATRRPRGAAATMAAIADNLQDRLKVVRAIEAERAKPRQTARLVTIISGGMLILALVFARSFLQPLATPAGQVIVVVAAVMYVGSLWWMQKMTAPRHRGRIMVRRQRS
ncbi:type II secretion system F family protein [Acidipropionibacterium acidipropionici]|nr:type II secretion system F family protein [Acidipropionibacterium acidipropionici]